MSTLHVILLAFFGAVFLVLVILLLLPSPRVKAPVERDIKVDAGAGSIITVRKVGDVTSLLIQPSVRDSWEGEGGVPLPALPPEVTRVREPALYAEYMDPSTSAVRRYEIIEDLYAIGYSLPHIRGLHEAYKKEIEAALSSGDPDARTALGRTPVNLAGAYRTMEGDPAMRSVPMEDMGDAATEDQND